MSTPLYRRSFCRAAAAGLAVPSSACRHGPRTPLDLWLAGDVHLGATNRPLFGDGTPFPESHIGIANLEGPVTQTAAASLDPAEPKLHNAPSALASLRQAGVRVVGIANNHAFDAGDTAPTHTAQAIASAGLVPAGLAAGIARVDHSGWRVGVAAYNLGQGLPAKFDNEIAAARPLVDILIVMFHVTGPPSYLPTHELREAVELTIATGADVVASHGTHAIGPVERRGHRIIAWGLGNLAFECDCTKEVDGLVLGVTVHPNLETRATAFPIDAGLMGASAKTSHNLPLMIDLLHAVGSTPLTAQRNGAAF